MEQTTHHVDNHTLLQIKTHANTITSADLYTNTVGRTWQATAQADDRGCGPAFITIVVGLTPAINTSHPSALSRSLHTMHIIPLSQNRPRSTRKYAEIQTEHCVVACVPRIPPPLNTNHTHTLFPSSFLCGWDARMCLRVQMRSEKSWWPFGLLAGNAPLKTVALMLTPAWTAKVTAWIPLVIITWPARQDGGRLGDEWKEWRDSWVG